MIDVKVDKWGKDEKMVDFLRPQTLFSGNFEAYRNEDYKQPNNPTVSDVDKEAFAKAYAILQKDENYDAYVEWLGYTTKPNIHQFLKERGVAV